MENGNSDAPVTVKNIYVGGYGFVFSGFSNPPTIFVPPYGFCFSGFSYPPTIFNPPTDSAFQKSFAKRFWIRLFFVQLRKSSDRGQFQKFKMRFEALIAISSLSSKIESDFDKI